MAKVGSKGLTVNYINKIICHDFGLPVPIPEYRFFPDRRWRLDFAWIDAKLAVEIEGGVWTKGAHIRPQGFVKDMEKYNKLTELGWALLRYVPAYIDYMQIRRVYECRINGAGISHHCLVTG